MTRPEARRRPQAFAAHQIADDFDDGGDAFDPFAPPAADVAPSHEAESPISQAAASRLSMADRFGRAFLRAASAITLPQVVVGAGLALATGVIIGLIRRRH